MTALWLSVAALIAYGLGCLDLTGFSCRYFLHRQPGSFGRGLQGVQALWREYKIRGLAAVYLPECLKLAFAVLQGGWLLGITDAAQIGRIFAFFCLVLGTILPVTRRFRGGRCIMALLIGSVCVLPRVGLFVWIVFFALLWATRYVSLGAVCGAFAGVIGTWVFIEDSTAVLLSLFCALLIAVRHAGNIAAVIKKTEPRISIKEDLSYKFDDKF